VFTH